MKDKIHDLLDDAIESEIRNLPNLEQGSSEKSNAIDNLTQLYKLRIEEAKIDQASVESDRDIALKQKQLEDQAKERKINIGLQLGLAFSSLLAYDAWYRRGLKFEETGVIRSPWIKNLVSRMFPKK